MCVEISFKFTNLMCICYASLAIMAAAKTSIKLIVDKEGKRVLVAEAKKDFVDSLSNSAIANWSYH